MSLYAAQLGIATMLPVIVPIQNHSLLQPSDFLTPSSYLEFMREAGHIPFRLKYQSPIREIPFRWLSHNR